MWELDLKDGWVLKNWWFPIIVLKTLKIPLDCKIKPVNPKGNQLWIFTGRTTAETEAPILWLPDAKSQLNENTTEGKKRRELPKIQWLDSITDSVDMNLSKLQEIVEDRRAWHAAVHGVTKSQIWPSDRNTTTNYQIDGFVKILGSNFPDHCNACCFT